MWICASKIFLNEAIGYKVYKFNHDGYLTLKITNYFTFTYPDI